MTDYAIIPTADYKAACDAIREKTGKTDSIKSGDMATEIGGISGGGKKLIWGFRNIMGINEMGVDTSFDVAVIHLIEGKTYTVQLENETFKMVCKKKVYTYDGGPTYDYLYLGNFYLYDIHEPNTGEEFVFYEIYENGEFNSQFYVANPNWDIRNDYFVTFLVYDGEVADDCDHSMEDGLIEGTITEYRNDRVTKVVFSPVSKSNELVTSVDFPNAVEIGMEVFFGYNYGLQSVNLPKAKTIGDSAFGECYDLANVNIPNAETIGASAFAYDESIEILDLPKVTSIGYGAFLGAVSLRALVLRGEKVVQIAVPMLQATSILSDGGDFLGTGFIYVPRDLVNAYIESTTPIFNQAFRALEDYTVDGTITGELDMSKI